MNFKFVKLDPNKIQFQDVDLPRPASIPYNRLTHPKIYAAGYSDGVFMVVFKTEEGKPSDEITYFRLVDVKTIENVIADVKEWCDSFVVNAINGIYPTAIEKNDNYFI